MRERIPLTEEMIVELLQLRDEGKSLRPLGDHFGVSHATIKRWLKSDEVARFVSSTDFKRFARGDSVRLTRDVESGMYQLKKGDIVTFSEFDPKNTRRLGFGRLPAYLELKLMSQWMPSKK